MHKWLVLIIQPAVHDLQSVHQSLWIISKICLSEAELVIVDPCLQRFFIHSVFHDRLECLFDHTDKCLFLITIRIFRDNRKDRLIDSIVIRTHDIFSDSCIQKRFFQRCTRCREQCIVQNLKRQIQLFIQTCPDDFIIRKIRIILLRLLTGDRILHLQFSDFFKRFLIFDLGIHFNRIKC